ncbi:MAG: hypothetical protein GXO61_01970 [Epsilonproteobacteria bacterium]|nr:hypothetical protein [Campylobacterota bacterium]
MNSYEALYLRWKKYRFKKFLKTALLLGVGVAGGFWGYKEFFKKEEIVQKVEHLNRPITNIITPSLSFENRLARYLHYKPKPKVHKKVTKKKVKPASTPLQPSPSQLLELESKQEDLTTLIEKFNIAPSKELALLIAREFYSQQNYPQTIKWSMKANEFDNKDEESWILFSKAAYKLGDKRKAINALKVFVQKSGSLKAKELLLSMYKGEFK